MFAGASGAEWAAGTAGAGIGSSLSPPTCGEAWVGEAGETADAEPAAAAAAAAAVPASTPASERSPAVAALPPKAEAGRAPSPTWGPYSADPDK